MNSHLRGNVERVKLLIHWKHLKHAIQFSEFQISKISYKMSVMVDLP